MSALIMILCLGACCKAAEPADAKSAAAAVDEALAAGGKRKRLIRIDSLLATYRGDTDPEAKLATLRLLTAKAELAVSKEKSALLDEALALYADAAPDALPDAVRPEMAKARFAKAETARGGEKTALLTLAARSESGAQDWRRRLLAFRARVELAAMEKDPAKKSTRLRALLAQAEADPEAAKMQGMLASAVTRLAEAAEPGDRAAQLEAVALRFADSADSEVNDWVMRARWSAAKQAEPGERFARLDAVLQRYKNSKSRYIQNNLSRILRDMVKLAETEPDARVRLDALAAGLKDSRADKRITPALLAAADLEEDAEARATRYRNIVDAYRKVKFNAVRKDVMSAAERLLALSSGKPDVLELCEGLADQYAIKRQEELDETVATLIAACAEAAGDDGEKIRLLDKILDLGREDRIPHYQLEPALKKKARLTGDPGSIAEYYDARYAAAPDDRTRCSLLVWKASAVPGDSERRAVHRTLFYRFADSRDPEIAEKVLRSADVLSNAAEPEEAAALYARVEAAFAEAETDAGKTILATALLGKGDALADKDAKLAAYDRAFALTAKLPGEKAADLSGSAVRAKSKLLNDPALLTAFYAHKASTSASPDEKAENLLLQAGFEPNRLVKVALYQAVIDEFDGVAGLVPAVAKALAGKAEAAERRGEAVGLYREALDRLMKLDMARHHWEVERLFGKMIDLAQDRQARIALHDEAIAFFRTQKIGNFTGKIRGFMLKKLPILTDPAEKIKLADEAIRLSERGRRVPDAYGLCKALFAKAELVETPAEKVALYDRILDLPWEPDGFFSGMNRAKAIAAKAEALRDEAMIPNAIRESLRLPATDSDIAFIDNLLDVIKDTRVRIDMCDAVLEFYRERETPFLTEALNKIRRTRGLAAGEDVSRFFPASIRNRSPRGDFAARMRNLAAEREQRERRHKDLQAEIAAEPDARKKRELIDAAVAAEPPGETSKESYDLLFAKAELFDDEEAKDRVYDDIIERSTNATTSFFGPRWTHTIRAFREKAGLRGDAAAKRDVYDEAIRRYSDSLFNDAPDFVVEMRLARLETLDSDEERIAELKRMLVDLLPYDRLFSRQKVPEVLDRLVALLARQSGVTEKEALDELLKSGEDRKGR